MYGGVGNRRAGQHTTRELLWYVTLLAVLLAVMKEGLRCARGHTLTQYPKGNKE